MEVLERFLYRFAPAFYLVTLVAVYIRSGKTINNFAFMHWLVTYESGYIKRGLVGTLFQVEWLAALFRVPASLVVSIISTAILALLFLSIVVICIKIGRLDKAAWIILPVLLTSPCLSIAAKYIGYLDHLVFLSIMAATGLLLRKWDRLAILICALTLLIHETAIIFSVPLLILFVLANTFLSSPHSVNTGDNKRMVLLLLVLVMLLLFLLMLQSYWISVDSITSYLNTIYKRNGFQDGPGGMVNVFSKSFFDWYVSESPHFVQRAISVYGILSTIVPLLLINATLYFLLKSRYEYAGVFCLLASLVMLTPVLLFLVAWDYDRIWSYPVILCIIFIWLVSEKGSQLELSRTAAIWLSITGLLLTVFYVSLPMHYDNVNLVMRGLIFCPIIFMSLCGVLFSFQQEITQ